jgi:hypothetical protein
MMSESFKAKAQARWPAALSIFGDGSYAVISRCPPGITVVLTPSLESAQKRKLNVDQFRCGRECKGMHEVVKL